jgi:hypothetical protein
MTRFIATYGQPVAWLLYLFACFALGMTLQMSFHLFGPSA